MINLIIRNIVIIYFEMIDKLFWYQIMLLTIYIVFLSEL